MRAREFADLLTSVRRQLGAAPPITDTCEQVPGRRHALPDQDLAPPLEDGRCGTRTVRPVLHLNGFGIGTGRGTEPG
ncbi:hypothetical protein LK08_05605 [Streptomyces sp. MUSC 125]|nr:hypothetical protein LK08_05605 [Streptomyces sp. MUSC 125]